MSQYTSLAQAALARRDEDLRPIPTQITRRMKVKGGFGDRVRDITIAVLVSMVATAGITYNYTRSQLQETQSLIKALTIQPASAVTPETTLPK